MSKASPLGNLIVFALLSTCQYNTATICLSSSCSSSYIACGEPSTVVLSRSGLKTKVIAPGATRSATQAGNPYKKPFLDKNALWVWDSDGLGANCNMSIVVQDIFY